MSINPNTYPEAQYSGTPFFNTTRFLEKSQQSPRFVPLILDWNIYFTALGGVYSNIKVPINLQAAGSPQGGLLDLVKAVKIDNTNSTATVSVFFPDTGDVITAQPNSVVTGPVMTNTAQCYIVAEGLAAGYLPTTKVYLANYWLPAWTDQQVNDAFPQHIASPNIPRDNLYTPGFSPPALGDQVLSNYWPMPTGGTVWSNIFATASSYKYIYLTHVYLVMVYGYNASAAQGIVQMLGSISGLLFQSSYYVYTQVQSVVLLNMQHVNIRLSTSDLWSVSNTGGIGPYGIFNMSFGYTVSNY